ncbi:MAG: phosphoribosylformylglycinamidine synthase [Eubacteriales bacterium]
MSYSVFRVFVERRAGFENDARGVYADLRENLLVSGLSGVRMIYRYDVQGISEDALKTAEVTIFSEPQSDTVSHEFKSDENERVFAVEYLPGQFDQRADSCAQCIQILTRGERPCVRTAKIYVLSGDISDEEFEKIKKYLINPVESREASFDMPATLEDNFKMPEPVKTITGFISMTDDEVPAFIHELGLAMDEDDVKFCRSYFAGTEKRDPTVTELRMIDTYWSDHCRHTTFLTTIDDVTIKEPYIRDSFERYLKARESVYVNRHKDITLMDLATMGAKYLKKTGQLKNLDESEEINACSVRIKVDVNGDDQDWLLMFKNETHNHPTEIEPFGGAATCLGGAIRDPLSGRSYVYQAMRVTGASDPRTAVSETLRGKLPQAKLTRGAANGYSSYGNQIGLATGGVYELYHPGYVAKRLEIGAVVGAAPIENVIREEPDPGDLVILLGGRTGRDGCGGATGSSKSHTVESLASCGAEVQKGNAPEERKIQRLFRNPEVTRMIRRCNDFGAGGVSVAIGELADGLAINLSAVPKKYEGLDGTELAVSESQERMAVVIRPADVDKFFALAARENLEATLVAVVTEEKRLTMQWNGVTTVNLSREFLNSNGAPKHTSVEVEGVDTVGMFDGIYDKIGECDAAQTFEKVVSDLGVCSQKGLCERFDSSIGAATVVMPFGGKNQLTAPQYMAAKIPVLHDKNGAPADTLTSSVMAYGFNPYLSARSPYHGAAYAVVESVAKLVASGVRYEDCYLTFQEFFERTKGIPSRWGKPLSALLGAFESQLELGIAAIGGKDSMSGSFEELDVPPTLVSFAIATRRADKLITPEFKKAGSRVYYLEPQRNADGMPDYGDLKRLFGYVSSLADDGGALSIYTLGFGGMAEAVFKMCSGNDIGFDFISDMSPLDLVRQSYGAFIIETDRDIDGVLIGETSDKPYITMNEVKIPLQQLIAAWEKPLEKVFPTKVRGSEIKTYEKFICADRPKAISNEKFARPRVIIPVFPGTNCEYDVKRRFEMAGADAEIFVLRNLTSSMLVQSLEELCALINNSQILMLPGGFSGGDEPDGSGKFITAVLRSPRVKHAVTQLIESRDGLVLGICNGFQALVKSGLLPYGKIMDEMASDCPTLTYNSIARHQSMMVHTRVASVKSPWLSSVSVGDIHTIPISHGEGRFTANAEMLGQLAANGQIATQYVDCDGNPTSDIRFNPNNSDLAIEGILSPDGRIFGKMGHSERIGRYIAKNVPGDQNQLIFESGVKYFK